MITEINSNLAELVVCSINRLQPTFDVPVKNTMISFLNKALTVNTKKLPEGSRLSVCYK